MPDNNVYDLQAVRKQHRRRNRFRHLSVVPLVIVTIVFIALYVTSSYDPDAMRPLLPVALLLAVTYFSVSTAKFVRSKPSRRDVFEYCIGWLVGIAVVIVALIAANKLILPSIQTLTGF